MIRYKISLVLIWFPFATLAQNLVPNPSFECGEDHCEPNQFASRYPIHACDWSCPNTATSDVYSTIVDAGCWVYTGLNPYSSTYKIGSQRPRTGNRYAGIICYHETSNDDVYREYIQAALKQPLVVGEYYCAEFYTSLADWTKYASNNLAIFFSEEWVYNNTYRNLLETPHIVDATIVSDTVNWVKVGSTFQADSPARYLIIGNFEDNTNTQVSILHINSHYRQSYYFIDDVSVEKMPYDQFTITGNTEICLGNATRVNALAGTDHIEWTTLADTSTVIATGASADLMPHTTTAYRVKAKGCNKTVIDTITITVNPLPTVELGIDSTICAGSSVKLDAGNDGATYRWQDNSDNRYLTVVDSGLYSVEVVDANKCRSRDERYITLADVPQVFLGNDTVICSGPFPRLTAGTNDWQYNWSTGAQDSAFTPLVTGTYWVDVRNQCGMTRDSIVIYNLEEIFLPNIVTANRDEKNDKLILEQAMGALHIYNRWGKEIFFSPAYKNDWPSDTDIPAGTYYYALHYPGCPPRKSWVQVVRE